MLRRLRRAFTPGDIASAVRCCRDAGLRVMLDLLLGAPGETEASLRRTMELMHRVAPDRVGVSLGVRLYPGTALTRHVEQDDPGHGILGADDPAGQLYFVDPAVADSASDLLEELIGGDPRFFFAPSGPDRGYNYSGNQPLVDAIRAGHRGAYWDILRRIDDGIPPPAAP